MISNFKWKLLPHIPDAALCIIQRLFEEYPYVFVISITAVGKGYTGWGW
jgi:hypothetical protein